jgi:hypothetical protein
MNFEILFFGSNEFLVSIIDHLLALQILSPDLFQLDLKFTEFLLLQSDLFTEFVGSNNLLWGWLKSYLFFNFL